MLHVSRAEQAAAGDRLANQPDNSTVHDDLISDGQITGGKLLLGGYFGLRNVLLPGKGDGFPGGELSQCYKYVVFGVDPEYFFGSHFFSPALCRRYKTRYRLNVACTVSTVKRTTTYLS